MSATAPKLVLITGGHGFIGSHIARKLYASPFYRVRIVDIAQKSSFTEPICHEFIQGDLCIGSMCELAVRGVHTVLHFAANMGGMGTIHSANDFVLYQQNHTITINILRACLEANVKRLFYASSACVYPESLQGDPNVDVSLCEDDVWTHPPPKPQGLYGLEKLNSEILLAQFGSQIDIRIARFHNVFGPRGAWNDGREKAPAAMLRKAAAMKILSTSESHSTFEIWGDGQQRRSFLYIDDAVEAILRLLESTHTGSFNIGSDSSVSIRTLADIALEQIGLNPTAIPFEYQPSKPVGVASRNSNNDRVQSLLGWTPATSLEDGMKQTSSWIIEKIKEQLGGDKDQDTRLLLEMSTSKVLVLAPQKPIVFAILLPITSRGAADPNACLLHLGRFAESLIRSTWRDVRSQEQVQYRFVVYVAIDDDDEHLLGEQSSLNKPERVLRDEGIYDIITLKCHYPRGHVCKIWKECARKAFHDGCNYMVLMGDDVELVDEGWMRKVHAEFNRLASDSGAPFGFGCVAFTDISFPGMPTFPVIHRTHMEIFEGEVIPDIFVNQDGDPFLFQLYRRWNCSTMFSSRISNSIGGGADARYAKEHARDWTFETLDDAVFTADAWLKDRSWDATKQITLDIVIPCYRVELSLIANILNLKSSSSCSVMFIIIIDNPASTSIFELQERYGRRPDVRIRVNKTNIGASGSRNRGIEESAADWIHFLDDDIVPDSDLLFEAEKVIREHPDAAGFVGNTTFPISNNIFTTAAHIAGVTYFWDIATKIEEDVPWGVTANLIARRNVKDGVLFDLVYPKTGGGEDIEFCRKKREASIARGGQGFFPASSVKVTHPWWIGGQRSYWRFYYWSIGDGALVKRFPAHTYVDFAPNSAEQLLLCCLTGSIAVLTTQWTMALVAIKALFVIILVNVLHDCHRHLLRHPGRIMGLKSSIRGPSWIAAVVESSFIRMFSEIGRLRGMISRGEYAYLGRRLDWFAGRLGQGPIDEERMNNVQRVSLIVLILVCIVRSF